MDGAMLLGTILLQFGTALQMMSDLMSANSVWVRVFRNKNGSPSSIWQAAKAAIQNYPEETEAFREHPECKPEIVSHERNAVGWLIMYTGAACANWSNLHQCLKPVGDWQLLFHSAFVISTMLLPFACLVLVHMLDFRMEKKLDSDEHT